MLVEIKNKVLNNQAITKEEALSLVNEDLVELKKAANEIRNRFCGQTFDLCSIINGKSGRCSENCKFCSQSSYYPTLINEYDLLDESTIQTMAQANENKGVGRFSIVTSGRKLEHEQFDRVVKIYQKLAQECRISLCASLGLLEWEQFKQLKQAGVCRYHNNLETSRNYFSQVCTSHTYDQKISTIKAAQKAGLEVCSGGIMGMGESWQDRLDLAFELKDLGINSVPINILNPIKGTPFEYLEPLSQADIERIFAIYRFILPQAVIRMAGGRGLLSDRGVSVFQSGANGAITGDMLTTTGITINEDLDIIKELGFEVNKLW